MSDVRPFRRFHLLVLLFGFPVLFSLSGCASYRQPPGGHGPPSPYGLLPHGDASTACSRHAKVSNYAPMLCVDDTTTTLRVDPESISVVKHNRAMQPTLVNWFTMSGTHTLRLTANVGSSLDDCFSFYYCSGAHCIAVMNVNAPAGKSCSYTASLVETGYRQADPIIHVDTCCPPPVGMP
jgi:hypothetical protein